MVQESPTTLMCLTPNSAMDALSLSLVRLICGVVEAKNKRSELYGRREHHGTQNLLAYHPSTHEQQEARPCSETV